MIQGTTPTLYFGFNVETESIKEFKIIIAQEGKENLIKTQNDCVIDHSTNIVYTKLSQEETLAFDTDKFVKIQVKALTNDNNVIANPRPIAKAVYEILDRSTFEVDTSTITPIDTNIIKVEFSNTFGFDVDFGDMIVYQELPADASLSSTSTNALQNKVITENFTRVDNEFLAINQRADTIEEIAKGATVAKSYLTYGDMVADLNYENANKYNVGQHFIIQTKGVPDLYVYGVSNTNSYYTYTDDSAIVSATDTGVLQIGYYIISQLETQKADLTEYAKKSQVPVINATLKENGAYTLTITMGVE